MAPPTISIHALLAESDQTTTNNGTTKAISIHALLAESDMEHLDCKHTKGISIHALLAESDICDNTYTLGITDISIHALLAESDTGQQSKTSTAQRFLSTLSLRRATSFIQTKDTPKTNFYPRSPCGERLLLTLI